MHWMLISLACSAITLACGFFIGFSQCGGTAGSTQAALLLGLIAYVGGATWLIRQKANPWITALFLVIAAATYVLGLGSGWAEYASTPDSSWGKAFWSGLQNQNC